MQTSRLSPSGLGQSSILKTQESRLEQGQSVKGLNGSLVEIRDLFRERQKRKIQESLDELSAVKRNRLLG